MYICEQCGKEVYENFGSGRFCNRSCSNKYVSLHQTEEAKQRKIKLGASNLEKGKHRTVAEMSDDERKRRSSAIKKSYTKERRKALSDKIKGKKLSKETRNKLSEIQKKKYKEGLTGLKSSHYVPSTAETIVKEILDSQNIVHKTEVPISKSSVGVAGGSYYSIDFLIDNNIDLEIDGSFHKKEEQKKKDRVRDKALQDHGYKVKRIKYEGDEIKLKKETIKFLKASGFIK